MDYDVAYKLANEMMYDETDSNLQALISKFDDTDWGTLRDRLADILVKHSNVLAGGVHSTKYYCKHCETLCFQYEQGLACDCGMPFDTEVIHEKDYPDHWVQCVVSVSPLPTNENIADIVNDLVNTPRPLGFK